MNGELARLREENTRLRNTLLALAKECAACAGSGFVPVTDEWQAAFGKELPCYACEDIRAALR